MSQVSIFIEKNSIYLIGRLALIIVLVETILILTYGYFGIVLSDSLEGWSRGWLFLGIVFVGPLIETWLCQYLVFKGVMRFTEGIGEANIRNIFIALSALIFAGMHYDTIWYVVYAFVPGVILAYCFYYFFQSRPQSLSPAFWFTAILHALVNGATFVVDVIYNGW